MSNFMFRCQSYSCAHGEEKLVCKSEKWYQANIPRFFALTTQHNTARCDLFVPGFGPWFDCRKIPWKRPQTAIWGLKWFCTSMVCIRNSIQSGTTKSGKAMQKNWFECTRLPLLYAIRVSFTHVYMLHCTNVTFCSRDSWYAVRQQYHGFFIFDSARRNHWHSN